jgi:hypothetical protein
MGRYLARFVDFQDAEEARFEHATRYKHQKERFMKVQNQTKVQKKGTGFPLQLNIENAERDEAEQQNLPNSPCRSTRLFRDRDHGSLAPERSPAA